MGIIFDKAEAARSLLETIKAHYDTFDLAALGEQFMNLFLGCIEGEVAHIESGRILQGIFLLSRCSIVAIGVMAAFVLTTLEI